MFVGSTPTRGTNFINYAESVMKRWYTVSYITDGRHQNVVEWEGFAEYISED